MGQKSIVLRKNIQNKHFQNKSGTSMLALLRVLQKKFAIELIHVFMYYLK